MEGITLSDSTMAVREEGQEEPQGLDAIAGVAPSSSSSAAAGINSTLVEIRFTTPTGAREHTFVAKRRLIEAFFPGLGGAFQPSTDEATGALFHEIRIPWLDGESKDPTLAWSGKVAEKVYNYYDHYLVNCGGKFPSFETAVLHTAELKDVPGFTEYELKLFRNSTTEEVDQLVDLWSVANYICGRSGPCWEAASIAVANIFDSKPIDEVLRLLRLDGKEFEMTPEEMEKIIDANAYLFDSWLTPPSSTSSSSEHASNQPANPIVDSVPIVELD